MENTITEYLNKVFPLDEIHSTNPIEYDSESGETWEDDNRIEFYLGDYDDENPIFRWYACEYFNPDGPVQNECPTVSLEYEYQRKFNSFFGDLWHEPFKKWFTENFNIPIKTVDYI